MKARLVQTRDTYRIYELSEPIKIGKSDFCGEINIKETFERLKKRIRKDIALYNEIIEVLGRECSFVMISDAHTHIERLVFPAFKYNGDNYGMSSEDIGGSHTMMIDGGDSSTIHPDDVYLRRLAQINKLKWEGIE